MCRRLAAQRVVSVKGAEPDAIGGDDADAVEHYLLDVQQRAVYIVSAPLGRTMGFAAVKLGLDQTACGGRIAGLHAYGVTARAEGQDRDIELRQRRTPSRSSRRLQPPEH